MDCFPPGQIIVYPKSDGPAAFEPRHWPEDDVHVLYSIEDILRHYGVVERSLEELLHQFLGMPYVVRVPAGRE